MVTLACVPVVTSPFSERCTMNDEFDKDDEDGGCGHSTPQLSSLGLPVSPRGYLHYRNTLPKRKLIIHLDIRNTILVADSVTDVCVEQALNSFLTGVVWGREENGQFLLHSDQPSIASPKKGLCTYYKFLEKRLVRNPKSRHNLRLQTGDFVFTPQGQKFQEHFHKHLHRLLWTYESHPVRDKKLTMCGRDGKPYHYILPSVYKLIYHLWESNRDFAIVIRTYGQDAPNVLTSLNYGLHGNHPSFSKSININVNMHPGTIKRRGDSIELFTSNGGQDVQQNLVYEKDIYRKLCNSQGISGYVDDFAFWQKHNYDHAAGKPFWVDLNDERHHHIFFDDNFRANDEDSIIDVRKFTRENPLEAVSMEHEEVARLENVFLVQANLLSSIEDEDYFIRMTNLCEQNFYTMFNSKQL
ncbi:uncharacterized protein LOC106052776 [Biomphalaria glabrata]|uniref:Uncharacterized protein LOC106052776 n=1 Tax=Biomphalaria glabrata TaxID=6526 RepID=A0A9U8DWX5_BIOGL|nr:uncharacterized protein LOC106052776 [Biomphalaria glabrata]XP_013063688.2 uncharacterized protein LOC106052776 [Biomphalaria glabrata]